MQALLRRQSAGAAVTRGVAGGAAKDGGARRAGASRFSRSCAPCHGEQAQGLIGPNLTDDRWIHGGSVEQIFQTVAKGWPAKGMPPWGRAMQPDELAALVSYVPQPAGLQPPEPAAGRRRPVRARNDSRELRWHPCPHEAAARARAAAGHERLFEIAPPEELLYSLSADGSRRFMHPVVRKGHYWHIRRAIAYALDRAVLRAAADPDRRAPGGAARPRDPALPPVRRHLPSHRQPAAGGLRLRRRRHGLLRRLDVRPRVVRLRLPADGLSRVPLPAHRGVHRRRADERSGT